MKTPLNKSRMPVNGKLGNDLDKIQAAADKIRAAVPETRQSYVEGIEKAQEAYKKAEKAKEEAQTEEDFDKACNDESHARDKEAFFKRQLERLDFTPRMEEATYYKHVDAVKATVEKAAADFRRVAEKAIEDIVAARAEYLAITKEADEALIALDVAANVLQSKYRYKTITFTGDTPAQTVEDRNEWTRHAIRYNGNGKGYDLIAKDGANWNKKTCVAWEAARRAGKDL